jgi:two-component system sensor histidine kinase BaeS
VETIAVAPVVSSATRAARLEHDPRLRLELDPALIARADAVRLRQVLLNLLTNADRHTPSDGLILVSARGQQGEAVIEVQNTGASLDDEQLARAFDRFWRADPSRQRATGGSGLGLAIVKHLVEAQGGRVWAAADAVGPTFGFALPEGAPGEEAREPGGQDTEEQVPDG